MYGGNGRENHGSFARREEEVIVNIIQKAQRTVKELLVFSHSVVFNSLRPYGLQHARLPCPLLSPRVCSNSRPLCQLCHPTISSSVALLLLLPSVFPSIRVFSNVLALCIKWPKYWSFSISPSNEYSVFL